MHQLLNIFYNKEIIPEYFLKNLTKRMFNNKLSELS